MCGARANSRPCAVAVSLWMTVELRWAADVGRPSLLYCALCRLLVRLGAVVDLDRVHGAIAYAQSADGGGLRARGARPVNEDHQRRFGGVVLALGNAHTEEGRVVHELGGLLFLDRFGCVQRGLRQMNARGDGRGRDRAARNGTSAGGDDAGRQAADGLGHCDRTGMVLVGVDKNGSLSGLIETL